MLVELSITNLAILAQLRLECAPGFNVLTGETGAGKSIIIDAVSLLLGGRADPALIRTGCEQASVEGVFNLPPTVAHLLEGSLQELGLAAEDEEAAWGDAGAELILRREVNRSGRSVCRVNGRAVPANSLREITRHLIDIHGQGDHLSLLQVRRHIDLLDRYEGLHAERQAFATLAASLRQVRNELAALRQDARELARRVDLLTFQADEIRAAKLQPNEEQELERERVLLANAEKLVRLASEAYEALSGGEEGQRPATDLLGSAAENLAALARLDPTLDEQRQTAESLLDQAEDLARTLRSYRDSVEFNPGRLEEIEERLALLHSLKRKYGDSLADVIAFGKRAQEELDRISHSEERSEELQQEEARRLDEMATAAQKLHQARLRAAEHMQQRIERELADLSMEQARFLIDIGWVEATDGVEVEGRRYAFDASGLDHVEFLIAPNPGEEPKPLVKIASGGETSRLMLAMKNVLSEIDPVPTLIFDEIDTGISGRTGNVVGRKLWSLAQRHQVFCVTHLAQMACYGERHFHVVKQVQEGRTVSLARALARPERIQELAVLLGGGVTEATQRTAEEMLKRVEELRT